MTTRKRRLKPNGTTRTPRPRIGYLPDDRGVPSKKQPRFNLGDDKAEYEYRYTLIRKLYAENCEANGCKCWSPLALSYARYIEKGQYEIAVPIFSQFLEDPSMSRDDLAVQYVQMLRVQQEWYPSIRLVPADQDLYCEGVQLNRQIESQHIRVLYNELSDDGIVEPATNSLLAFLWHEVLKPLWELHLLLRVVLRERRIGNHSLESTDFTFLIQVHRILDRVTLPDVCTANAMQNHVHLADRPCATI